ncbi:YdhK family protein [Exiguobacterium sp.]|uniref:YdhK family protein n=1 Tax=Exiguobacterium sp. TaxID=44751 RepID=UPI00263BC3E1|nr:YdhK family protein [Exiguobacterium sp.]MCC5893442.1 YdhK family protein [Exiguobacterium sp.]
MKQKKWATTLGAMLLATSLAACGDTNDTTEEDQAIDVTEEQIAEQEDEHGAMDHSGSGEVPAGLEEATDPTYPIDSTAVLTADHMLEMEGAEAKIVGAYETTAYAVTYTPTDGGEPVEDHKWVIHEEIDTSEPAPLADGTEVTLQADHMDGMDGATATIESSEETTVYMVNFMLQDGSEVTNHKWVTESELQPKE